jgi:hypothetical protein
MSNIMIMGFFCILHSSYVPGLRPFVLLNEINLLSVKICRRGKEMEAAASLFYSTLFDLIQTAKYIG